MSCQKTICSNAFYFLIEKTTGKIILGVDSKLK